MPRHKDPSSRVFPVTVKVTREEKRKLTGKGGGRTPGPGLRWLIDKYLGAKQ